MNNMIYYMYTLQKLIKKLLNIVVLQLCLTLNFMISSLVYDIYILAIFFNNNSNKNLIFNIIILEFSIDIIFSL